MKFEIVPPAKAKLLRESFIQKFLDTSSDYYRKHIASMSQYADDLFYDGYLWDCLQCNEKYQKECSMEVAAGCMCEGLWLPEDIYCFDESMEWYVIFIHEGWEKGWEKPNDPELNEDDYIRICFLHTFHT